MFRMFNRRNRVFVCCCGLIVAIADVDRNEHCLLERAQTNRTEIIDWGGHDRLIRKWFKEHVAEVAKSKVIVTGSGSDPCHMSKRWRKAEEPHSVFCVSENYGLFYSHIPNRTMRLKVHGYWNDRRSCIDQPDGPLPPGKRLVPGPADDFKYAVRFGNPDDIERWLNRTRQLLYSWLDSPNLRLVVTTQQIIEIEHDKILPIPLGVRPDVVTKLKEKSQMILTFLSYKNATSHLFHQRKRLLLINNSGWRFRSHINTLISENFKAYDLRNLYCEKQVSCPDPSAYGDHMLYADVAKLRNSALSASAHYLSSRPEILDHFVIGQILQSKFVLCPPGLGYDSYRIWETLYLGAIPVIERSNGPWDSLFYDLPVLLVDNFSQVTPTLLEEAYPTIISRCATFNFEKLTKAFWIRLFYSRGVFGDYDEGPRIPVNKTT